MPQRDPQPGAPGDEPNFVLIDTAHPTINRPERKRSPGRPQAGNRQSAPEGARQGGDNLGSEGGAPGPDASSGV